MIQIFTFFFILEHLGYERDKILFNNDFPFKTDDKQFFPFKNITIEIENG